MQNKIGLHLSARSEVPGYMGFVPGSKAENMYGVTYANVVKDSKNLTVSGQSLPPQIQYLTMNQGNSQRIRDKLDCKLDNPQSKFWKNTHNLNVLEIEKEKERKSTQQKLKCKNKREPCFDMTLEQAYQRF